MDLIESINNNDILVALRSEFTTTEQELFVQSFGLYLRAKPNEFVIDFDSIWTWIGLSRKNNAKRLLISRMEEDVDYKILLLGKEHPDLRGGHNKETILLSANGFKSFCLLANTEKGKEIRKYFIKVEKVVFDLISKKYDEQLKQMQESMKETIKHKIMEVEDDKSMRLHESLIQAFSSSYSLIYIGFIRYEGDKMIIKIGLTDKGAKDRNRGLVKTFGSMRLMHVFECTGNHAFEKFLFEHPDIACLYYDKPTKKNNGISQETFLVSKEELDHIVQIIQENKCKFSDSASVFHEIELERIKLEQIRIQTRPPQEIVHDNVPIIPNKDVLHANVRKQNRGQKLQRYCPDGVALLQTYAGYADALRDPLFQYLSISVPGLKEAINKNAIYKGYRWVELPRNLPDDTVQSIATTSITTHQIQIGFIAMLNIDKDHIVEVYADQQAAKDARKLKSSASISQAIAKRNLCSGHYFMLYDEVPEDLKRVYLATRSLPERRSRTNAKKVLCLDSTTKKLQQSFPSMAAVLKKFAVSRATLETAIQNCSPLCGFVFEYES